MRNFRLIINYCLLKKDEIIEAEVKEGFGWYYDHVGHRCPVPLCILEEVNGKPR